MEEDPHKERVWTPFLKCNETGLPLTFHFRESSRSRIPCTVQIDDPTFHIFQAYLHYDFPLACRLQSRKSGDNWAAIPVNLVGKVELSHFDLETKLNFIIHYDRRLGWITGGVGYGIGPTVTSQTVEKDLGWQRVKIGDRVRLDLSVK